MEDCFGVPHYKSNLIFISACRSPMYLGVGLCAWRQVTRIVEKLFWTTNTKFLIPFVRNACFLFRYKHSQGFINDFIEGWTFILHQHLFPAVIGTFFCCWTIFFIPKFIGVVISYLRSMVGITKVIQGVSDTEEITPWCDFLEGFYC